MFNSVMLTVVPLLMLGICFLIKGWVKAINDELDAARDFMMELEKRLNKRIEHLDTRVLSLEMRSR